MTYPLLAPGDLITSDFLNTAIRQGVIPCGSDSHPTDPHEGMIIYEVDTGVTLRWTIRYASSERWTYVEWDSLDNFGSPVVGVVPDDIFATRPVVYERRADPNIANDSGGVDFPWPNIFPNCIFSYQVSPVAADPSSVLFALRSFDNNVDLGQWSGQAFGLVPEEFGFAVGYVPIGTPIEIAYRVVGC